MNKIYTLIWSDARQTWMVAHEAAAVRGKPSSRNKSVAGALAVQLLAALLCQGAQAQVPAPGALPTGGQVVAGQASLGQAGNTLTIRQSSDRAILNWQSFNIGSQAAVKFQQPSNNAVALNRVLGSDPSAIYGSLTANGHVFLVNPNGVLFGPGAKVDVGGLVASSLNLRNEDFLAGRHQFSRDGARGSVVNQGELTARYVALLAPQVRNEGVIVAPMGTVALAAGEAVTLGISGNHLIDVQVERASIDTLVENRYLVQAEAGTVVMSAQSANTLLGSVVNSGAVAAQGISTDGGSVRLLASGSINHSGSISVDAGVNGNGGTAIVLASLDNPASRTVVNGSISAKGGSASGNGGFIETSASRLGIADSARIDTSAPHGATGRWLLDPYDFTIAAVGGDITGSALSTALGTSNVTIQTLNASAGCTGATCSGGTSSGNGDVFVNDAVSWSSNRKLTLSAWRNVNINAPISANASGGGVALEFAQSDVTANFPSGTYIVNAPINLAAGATFSTKAASDGATTPYTVITDPAGLAGISTGLGGNYVLGGDVALPGTSWTPLGTMGTPFTGNFEGLGHKVTGLAHTNAGSDTEVGLFGANTGLIQNVGVVTTGATGVEGSQNVGALVGYNNGFVVNSYAQGVVTGNGAGSVGGIGGLVGFSQGPIQWSYADVAVTALTGDQTSGSPMPMPLGTRGTGGIGGLTGVATSAVSSSYAKGSVKGLNAVGGLVGYSAAGIDNSYSSAVVNAGVSGATNVGGLIGQVDQPSSATPFIFSSFWDTATSGQGSSAEGLGDAGNVQGLGTTAMKTTSTFTGVGWSTLGTWELRNGQYPLLKQMLQPIFVYAINATTTYAGTAFTGAATVAAGAATGSDYSGAASAPTSGGINVGTYTLAPFLTLTNPGSQSGYRVESVNGTLTINPATLTYTANAASRTFGAANPTFSGTVTGFVNSETQGSATTGTLAFTSTANTSSAVGNYPITGSGLTANNGNYTFVQAAGNSTALTINAAQLSLNTTASKTYDGSNIFNSTHSYVLTGMVNSDPAPTVVSGTATVASANAGNYTSFDTNSLTLSNANYALTGTVSATINPASLAVSGLSAANKVYDATTAATLIGTPGVSALGSDSVSVSGTAVGTFINKNVGTGKVVTVTGLSLSGAHAANYTIVQPSGLIASITQANLAISGLSASNKVYDTTTAATLSGTASVTPLLSDSVSVSGTAVGTFANKNVGTAKPVTVSGFGITGPDSGNYTVVQPSGLTATITPAPLTLTASDVAKTYDGTTTAPGASATISSGSIFGSDTISGGSFAFTDRHAGTGKTVTVSGVTVSDGNGGANYAISYAPNTTSTILQRPLSTWSGGAGSTLWSAAGNWDALPDASNVLSVTIPSGVTVSYDLLGTTSLQSIASAGTLAMSAGTLSLSGALNTSGYSQTAGAVHANSLSVTNSFSQTGGSISLSGSASITHNPATVKQIGTLSAASVTLNASNATGIVQNGSLQTEVLEITSSSSAPVQLAHSGNQIASIVMSGGSLTLVNTAAPLEITSFSGSALNIDNTGGIVTTGAIDAPVGSVTFVSHSPITIGAPVTAGGSIQLTSSGTAGNDNITINAPLSSTGGAVRIQSADGVAVTANISAATSVSATYGTTATFAPGITVAAPSVSVQAARGQVAVGPEEPSLTPTKVPALLASVTEPDPGTSPSAGAMASLKEALLNVANSLTVPDGKKEDRSE